MTYNSTLFSQQLSQELDRIQTDSSYLMSCLETISLHVHNFFLYCLGICKHMSNTT